MRIPCAPDLAAAIMRDRKGPMERVDQGVRRNFERIRATNLLINASKSGVRESGGLYESWAGSSGAGDSARLGWHRGHQNVTRSPSVSRSISVPQRRQGEPPRPYT
jgi:hypothetical protein